MCPEEISVTEQIFYFVRFVHYHRVALYEIHYVSHGLTTDFINTSRTRPVYRIIVVWVSRSEECTIYCSIQSTWDPSSKTPRLKDVDSEKVTYIGKGGTTNQNHNFVSDRVQETWDFRPGRVS